MKLDDILSKKRVKKVRKEIAPFDTGGQDEMHERAAKWKIVEKEDKLAQIRMQKQKQLLAKALVKERNRAVNKHTRDAFFIWQKANWLLWKTLTPEAYNHLENVRKTNGLLYKALFRCLVEPAVLKNIDAYMNVVRKNPLEQDKKVQLKNVLWYEDRLLNRKRDTTITIDHKGEQKRTI